MWNELPLEQRNRYRQMILAFASLTNAFAQKNNEKDGNLPVPIVNSKYQESVFQIAFNATSEDISNTSFDASISLTKPDGHRKKFLVGLKVFSLASAGNQKVAQFKANRDEWAPWQGMMRKNVRNTDGSLRSVEEVNEANKGLYLKMAQRLAELRNKRIKSSEEMLKALDSIKYIPLEDR